MIPEVVEVVKAVFRAGDWWLRRLLLALFFIAVAFGMFAAMTPSVKTKAFVLFVVVLGTVAYTLAAASPLGVALAREGLVGDKVKQAVNWGLGAAGVVIVFMVVLTLIPAWLAPEYLLVAEVCLVGAILLGLATGRSGQAAFHLAFTVALLGATTFLAIVAWRSPEVGGRAKKAMTSAVAATTTPQPSQKNGPTSQTAPESTKITLGFDGAYHKPKTTNFTITVIAGATCDDAEKKRADWIVRPDGAHNFTIDQPWLVDLESSVVVAYDDGRQETVIRKWHENSPVDQTNSAAEELAKRRASGAVSAWTTGFRICSKVAGEIPFRITAD